MASEGSDRDRLEAAMVAPGAGASFSATRHHGLARVEPLTAAAEQWLRNYAGEESSWQESALVLEMRYWPHFVDTAIAAGHTFERDAYPN